MCVGCEQGHFSVVKSGQYNGRYIAIKYLISQDFRSIRDEALLMAYEPPPRVLLLWWSNGSSDVFGCLRAGAVCAGGGYVAMGDRTLRHQNIVEFLGIVPRPLALVTELCAQGSLYQILR